MLPTEPALQIEIDTEQGFVNRTLLDVLALDPSFELLEERLTHHCFGPLEISHELRTSHGDFIVEKILEGDDFQTGIFIHSSDPRIMEFIHGQIRNSDSFEELPGPETGA